MSYLLDTCALIFMVFAPEKLSELAVQAIQGDNALYIEICKSNSFTSMPVAACF